MARQIKDTNITFITLMIKWAFRQEMENVIRIHILLDRKSIPSKYNTYSLYFANTRKSLFKTYIFTYVPIF